MKNVLCLLLFILGGCAGPQKEAPPETPVLKVKTNEEVLPVSYQRAHELLQQMTEEEKNQVLKTFITLRALSTGHINPTTASSAFFKGIPRLGIPSIEFVGSNGHKRPPARVEGRTLRLGSVNLIRNFEKTQVYENFAKAGKVDEVLAPSEKQPQISRSVAGLELQDLDIFLVKEGSEEADIKEFVCAIHRRGTTEYNCIESGFEEVRSELGLKETIAEAFKNNRLTPSQRDKLVVRMLAAMHELKIIS